MSLSVTGPAFGLDANLAPPPLSALLSLMMVAGVDALGVLALRRLPLNTGSGALWRRCQAPVVGAAILAVTAFPLALAGVFPRALAMALALILAGWGALHGSRILRQALARRGNEGRIQRIGATGFALAAFVAGYVLLALGPITEADSLDYHVGVALETLNAGGFPPRAEWFHSRLAGSGEVLIAIGLSVGAEQFGALLQLLGVLAVVSVFLFASDNDPAPDKWLALAVVSCPAFVAWVASPKPMLLPGAMTTAALLLIHFHIRTLAGKDQAAGVRNAFLLVSLLTMTAATMKLNFLFSGAVVGGLAAFLLLRSRFTGTLLLVAPLMFCLILLPFAYWKTQHFGGGLVAAFLQAFPGSWPGMAAFEAMLRAYRDTPVAFPASLLFPSGIGTVTTVLGVGLVFLASCARWRETTAKEIVVAALIVTVGGIIFGQRNARFFLEPFYWFLMACHLGAGSRPPMAILNGRTVKTLIAVQAAGVYAMLSFGVATVLPGAILPSWREAIMTRSANGYAAMRWADEMLPQGITMISGLRSVGLAPRAAISSDWRSHVTEGRPGERVYESIVAARNPEFLLAQTAPGAAAPAFPCAREIFAGPFTARVATRNPSNAGAPYDVWLLRTDTQCLRREAGQ